MHRCARSDVDGGYGWLVVLGSFLVHNLVLGLQYSFGIFFVEIVNEFDANEGSAAWVPALAMAFMMGTSPLSGILVRSHGTRAVALLGAVVIGLGMSLASLSTQLWHVTIAYGVLTGMGFSLAYVPSIVVLAHYWEKRRSLATGIAVAGSGSGTLVMAAITDALLRDNTWKQVMLMEGLAGMVLVVLCALTYAPPLREDAASKQVAATEKPTSTVNGGVHMKTETCAESPSSAALVQEGSPGAAPDAAVAVIESPALLGMQLPPAGDAAPELVLLQLGNDSHSTLDGGSSTGGSVVGDGSSVHSAGASDGDSTVPGAGGDAEHNNGDSITDSGDAVSEASACSEQANPVGAAADRAALPSEKQEGGLAPVQPGPSTERAPLGATLRRLWGIRKFRCLVFALGPNALGYLTPFTHLKAYAISDALQLDGADASLVLSAIGVASVVGRLVMGRVADMSIAGHQPHIVRNWLFLLSGFGAAMSVAGMGGALSLGGLLVAAMFFGVFSGAILSIMPVITADAVGVADLPVALPIMYFVQVPGFVVGAPIAGWVKVAVDSYRPAFALSGGLMLLGASALLPLAWDWSPRADAAAAAAAAQQKGQPDVVAPVSATVPGADGTASESSAHNSTEDAV